MNSIRHICSLRRHICSLKRHIFEIGTHSILNSPVDNKGESRELKSRRILDILNIILNVCDINLQLVYKTTYFISKWSNTWATCLEHNRHISYWLIWCGIKSMKASKTLNYMDNKYFDFFIINLLSQLLNNGIMFYEKLWITTLFNSIVN